VHRVAATIGQDLWHPQQRQTLGAQRRAGHPHRHEVDDAVGQAVLAAADEDLVAGDGERAIVPRLGAGAQQAEVAAGMGLGQAHRRQPFAAGHRGQVALEQLAADMGMQALVSAVQQPRVHGPGVVGRRQHPLQRRVRQLRQALAAAVGVAGQPPSTKAR
jgi:hypothetical protein